MIGVCNAVRQGEGGGLQIPEEKEEGEGWRRQRNYLLQWVQLKKVREAGKFDSLPYPTTPGLPLVYPTYQEPVSL